MDSSLMRWNNKRTSLGFEEEKKEKKIVFFLREGFFHPKIERLGSYLGLDNSPNYKGLV